MPKTLMKGILLQRKREILLRIIIMTSLQSSFQYTYAKKVILINLY